MFKKLKRRLRFARAMVAVPEGLRLATRYQRDRVMTSEEADLVQQIERYRGRVAGMDGDISVMSRPLPAKQVAQIGSSPHKGIFMHRLATGLKASRILELGTNTGMSGAYFVNSPYCEELLTVERSPSLCTLAEENLSRFGKKHRIVNALFDDAIDCLLEKPRQAFDLAFIDGHHRYAPTLSYAEKIRPLLKKEAYILFDDIRWSDEMHRAWAEIQRRYPATFDFGSMGLVALRASPQHLNLQRRTSRVIKGSDSLIETH